MYEIGDRVSALPDARATRWKSGVITGINPADPDEEPSPVRRLLYDVQFDSGEIITYDKSWLMEGDIRQRARMREVVPSIPPEVSATCDICKKRRRFEPDYDSQWAARLLAMSGWHYDLWFHPPGSPRGYSHRVKRVCPRCYAVHFGEKVTRASRRARQYQEWREHHGVRYPDLEDLLKNPDPADPHTWALHLCLGELREREAGMLSLRYGLNGHEKRSTREVAACFGLKAERTRQILNEAKRRLRHPYFSRQWCKLDGGSITSPRMHS